MSVKRTTPDQFQLRLPAGLRDRVKAYAELQGRSTNTEIVRVLEREFPEPESIEGRVFDLIGLAEVLSGAARQADVDKLVGSLLETARGIVDGTIQGLDEEARRRVKGRLERWEDDFAEDIGLRNMQGLDDIEIDAVAEGKSTAKYPMDREWRKLVRASSGKRLSEEEHDAFARGFDAGVLSARQAEADDDADDRGGK